MDPDNYNSTQDDYDKDGAINVVEWENGTNPCDPDTDDGGEMDGSEINGGRDPHFAPDDKVPPLLNFSIRPLNGGIFVRWSRTFSYTLMLLHVEGVGSFDMGRTGEFTLPLKNDTPFTVTLQGATAEGEGPASEAEVVIPKADPDAPSGFVQINGGAPQTLSRNVMLHINASDMLLDGLPSPGGAASIANAYTAQNVVSGEIMMRFTNNTEKAWSPWQPYAPEKPWVLDPACDPGQQCPVYAQFKDGVENMSLVVFDDILYEPFVIYLPLVTR